LQIMYLVISYRIRNTQSMIKRAAELGFILRRGGATAICLTN
jgi:hypothetical protein